MKLKDFFSYWRLKTQQAFFLVNLMKQFFYIQNRKMCLSKKILYQYFVVFCPAIDSFSFENILYVTA